MPLLVSPTCASAGLLASPRRVHMKVIPVDGLLDVVVAVGSLVFWFVCVCVCACVRGCVCVCVRSVCVCGL